MNPGEDITGGFDFQPRTRIRFGAGTVARVGELAAELGGRRVLVVTDPGIVRAGHAERVEAALRERVEAVAHFTEVQENPDTRTVDACLAVAREFGPDLLVGLGGGSAMDTAKGANFLLTNGGCMADYRGVGKAARPMLPLIAIPTTAGTGSECQSAALIAEADSHRKMACLDPKAAPRVALLDPELTLSQPPRVTADTGMDALAHAVETAVTKARHPFSLIFSHRAARLLAAAFPRVLADPADRAARGDMLLGAALAGLAIENSMLGAAHAAANPLSAHHGVVHGEAVGLMLPAVVRFNAADPPTRRAYAELAGAIDPALAVDSEAEATAALVRRLEELRGLAGLPTSLASCGVSEEGIPALAEEAAAQWTAGFNPRPLSAADFAALYRGALGA